jgi:DNA polymerase I
MNRLVLIDGNAILHRAYHALPPLTAPDGSLVNAVYGFCTMLFKIVHDLKPTHIAVAFDRPAPTFRKKLYKEYQATRPKMDEELVGQIEKVHDMVRAFGVPIYEKDGFEADDVIGTLARRAEKTIDQVIIVTGDKDILQLVDDKTYVYMPTKGLSEAKLYMEKEVVERMGVKPTSIVDLKALMGDSSDNYPGVEGIGPKTAVTILEKYGTIEKLYQKGNNGNWGDLGEKVKEKLIKGEESAKMSKDLATIRTDVPIEGELKPVDSIDTPEAREMLSALHFHSLLKRLSGEVKNKEKAPAAAKTKASEQQQLF